MLAEDRELSPFNRFTLSWREAVDKFAIDRRSGVITTTQSLDHEIQVKLSYARTHFSLFFSVKLNLFVTTSFSYVLFMINRNNLRFAYFTANHCHLHDTCVHIIKDYDGCADA